MKAPKRSCYFGRLPCREGTRLGFNAVMNKGKKESCRFCLVARRTVRYRASASGFKKRKGSVACKSNSRIRGRCGWFVS